ncbi:VRR-NUC domain-containing protein [Pleionea litopenaei]|uniref:phosphodiesterase I n=1 Tax=Pleionea litopenaei TaxID=3070815 RepID=A0AA51RWY1_9GAMM|nr:VRR-NUC domain-containing protein [Pleionea sp. HL-JVS1]WMS88979.1 VRR-NUC domain-containing protein [Pleionea sp. HL-JVS1]
MSKAAVTLEGDYYLHNVRVMLKFVVERYQFLLNESELNYYETFSSLSDDAQRLYTRCLMRKGEWFRLNKLQYSEISNREQAFDELLSVGFSSLGEVSDFPEILRLFTRTELIDYFAELPIKTLKRKEMDDYLISLFSSSPASLQSVERLFECPVLKISSNIFDVFRLLFFGNLHQDLTEFVLQDLGIVTYPSYVISDVNLPIQSRQALTDLFVLHEMSEQLYDAKDLSDDVLIEFTSRLTSVTPSSSLVKRRYDRLANRLGREFERNKNYSKAIELYQLSDAIPSNERLIRCLDYMGEYALAWQRLQETTLLSSSSSEQHFTRVFGPKLAKKLDVEFLADKLQVKEEDRIQLCKVMHSVELDVANHYLSNNALSFWSENALMNSLFALTFWEAMFLDIDGAFYNPFQSQPSDLYEHDFTKRREVVFDRIFSEMQDETLYRKRLLENYTQFYGQHCRFIHWGCLEQRVEDWFDTQALESCDFVQEHSSVSLFELALNKIPLSHIAAIVTHILKDPKEHRSGLPDLIVFDRSGYRLVEVKGPGDRLQNNQKIWMDFFSKNKVPHQVIRVDYHE